MSRKFTNTSKVYLKKDNTEYFIQYDSSVEHIHISNDRGSLWRLPETGSTCIFEKDEIISQYFWTEKEFLEEQKPKPIKASSRFDDL